MALVLGQFYDVRAVDSLRLAMAALGEDNALELLLTDIEMPGRMNSVDLNAWTPSGLDYSPLRS